jgi:hypothetical protein
MMSSTFRLFLFVLGIAVLGQGQEQRTVLCGTGISDGDCHFAIGTFHLAIEDLPVDIPAWRWVIVPSEHWAQVAHDSGVKPSVPAFSNLDTRSTYVNASLVFPSQRIDENLQRYSSRTGTDRLRWVLAHESGHILCQTHNEQVAEKAAGRLQSGGNLKCR